MYKPFPETFEFDSLDEAIDWMINQHDDGTLDNIRYYYTDNNQNSKDYEEKFEKGCCAFFDKEVIINGRVCVIGCNFGH